MNVLSCFARFSWPAVKSDGNMGLFSIAVELADTGTEGTTS